MKAKIRKGGVKWGKNLKSENIHYLLNKEWETKKKEGKET